MTSLIPALSRTSLAVPPPIRLALGAAAVCLASVAAGRQASEPQGFRLVMAAAALLALVGLGLYAPRKLLYLLVVWLVTLGLVRRVVTTVSPRGELDPLLVVGPAAIGVLVLAAWSLGAFQSRTRLGNLVLILSGLVLLSAFNPLHGTFEAGTASLLFVLVPMGAFWVGRGLCDDATLMTVYKLVAGLGLGAALYGISQTLIGFTSWDSRWIDEYGYAALNVGVTTRPFGTSSSAAEYAGFVAICLVVWFCLRSGLARTTLAAGAVVLLGAALILASSRGAIFTTVAALALVTVARRGLPLVPSLVVGVLVVLLVPFAATRLAPATYGEDAVGNLLSHQLEGLSDPLDPNTSTLLTHWNLIEDGIRRGLEEPLGLGVGAITIAGEKFRGQTGGNITTEADPSNLAVALGIPGLFLYAIFTFIALGTAYSLAVRRRDALALISLGVLIVTFLQWFAGGHYAVAFLAWLAFGWVDRAASEEQRAVARDDLRPSTAARSPTHRHGHGAAH